MGFQIHVTGEWAGRVGGWRPAIDGTINQTDTPASEASTFEDEASAEAVLHDVIATEAGDALTESVFGGEWAVVGYDDKTVRGPRFRIVEVG